MNKQSECISHPVCPYCGSDKVVADAKAIWNGRASQWELHSVYDHGLCLDCETEIRHVGSKTSAEGDGHKPVASP